MQSGTERLHVIVEGRVQGVGYRSFVLASAINLDLTGWVRNRWSGDVEVLAEGPRSTLETFLELLKKGPNLAHVENLTFEWEEASGSFEQFTVEFTR